MTITAPPPTVDLKSTSSGISLVDTMIHTQSLQRSACEMAYLAPGAVEGGVSTPKDASVHGSTGAENHYRRRGLRIEGRGGTLGGSHPMGVGEVRP